MTTPETLPDYQIAKRDCLEFIASLGITAEIKSNGVAETAPESKEDKPWLHFRWGCVVTRTKPGEAYKGRAFQANFDDYKTGIGNSTFRRIPTIGDDSAHEAELAKKGQIHRFLHSHRRISACKHLKPTPPDIADILGSYARDYFDAHQAGSFEEWAGNFGYDEDSRKGERIYQTCLAQRKPLLALGLSMSEIEKIAEFAGQF